MIGDGRGVGGGCDFGLGRSRGGGGRGGRRRWQEVSGAADEPVAIARSGFSVRGPRTENPLRAIATGSSAAPETSCHRRRPPRPPPPRLRPKPKSHPPPTPRPSPIIARIPHPAPTPSPHPL